MESFSVKKEPSTLPVVQSKTVDPVVKMSPSLAPEPTAAQAPMPLSSLRSSLLENSPITALKKPRNSEENKLVRSQYIDELPSMRPFLDNYFEKIESKSKSESKSESRSKSKSK